MNLFLDIETIGSDDPAVREQIAAKITPPANYKKAETIEKWNAEEKPALIDEAMAKTSFDGATGKIVCIGWAFENEPASAQCSANERALLTAFFFDIQLRMKASGRDLTVIGHNLTGFDLKFLWKRTVILGIRPPGSIPFKAKPWDPSVFDTMVQWDADTSKRISLDNLCRALDVPSSKGDMDGSKVWETFKAGEHDKIAAYCAADVEATRNVYRRMIFAVEPASFAKAA